MNLISRGCIFFGFSVLVFGCNPRSSTDSNNVAVEKRDSLQQVRLHFTNFQKSKSGAT